MEKSVTKTLIRNVDSQLFDIVNNLICSICQELFYKPVTTPCGHSFCNRCIKRVLSSKDNSGCPLCKNPVKRYGLEADEVKATLTEICQELPAAFEKDVQEFTKNFADAEDIISTLKLSQIQNQEYGKEISSKKQKSVPKRRTNKLKQIENDSETFIPVLKSTTNVQEYPSAKKKKLDDLVSVSQTEPASNSSLCDSSELFKKLEKIEKIPPEEKVSKWFSDVGDNIYINSPSSSILGRDIKCGSESGRREDEKPTMIRRDYIKTAVSSKNEGEINKSVDPYEFIPSQNNQNFKRKHQKKSTGKKIPDFKALQSFTKESIKRNTILLNNYKEEDVEEDSKNMPKERQITASQKFEELLSETKKEEKKTHVLYSASQSSSTQFLDVSFHSKTEIIKKKKTPRAQKRLLDVESVLFKNVEVLTEEKTYRKSSRCKRRRSSETPKSEKKKKLFSEIINMPSSDASELEKSVEKYLINGRKDGKSTATKLGTLLEELINDDIIYATRPTNAPVRLPDLGLNLYDETINGVTQNTGLIGFCTQEETSDEKIFKKVVENMEKELNSREYFIGESEQKAEVDHDTKDVQENTKPKSPMSEDENQSCGSAKLTCKVSQVQFIKFLYLGRLTPVRKRSKSTVVKLVFPIGLTSLARRHAFENQCASPVPRKQTRQVSTGIQTSQSTASCLVQTSQVPHLSVSLQTSQEIKPSVEVQTTQKWTASAEIQTSQRLVCQEIQTTQIGCQSMQVQTTQFQSQLSPNSISEFPESPNQKHCLQQHRKIIQRKKPKKSALDSPSQLCTPKKQPADKDLIMDFGTEKEHEESLWNSQKQDNLIDLNKKNNNEENHKPDNGFRKSLDAESDDSDIQPPKRRNTFRILSQNSAEVLEEYETRQLIPLDVRKLSQNEEMEVINLATPGSQNSEEQMLRVLKNIDLDLPKGKGGNSARGEKSEESDCDFVEQTPPRPISRGLDDIKNVSKIQSGVSSPWEVKESEGHAKQVSGGTDLIEDSLPKGFSESFLLMTAPHKTTVSPDKNQKNETQKKTLKIEPTIPIDLPNENDQNKLNASEDNTKVAQLKAAIDAWKRTELSSPIKTTPPKKLCVVASSVKNSETIKKFVVRFKVEYLNKPMKHMTHLIVGLHENEDKEVLPLCTPKLLFAMANKKWVVSELWAETCLKMDMVVPEENFETLDPVGGRGCRKARLSCEKLLKNCEIYLLGDFQMISKEDFATLILDCGGTLVPSPEKFSFLPTKLRMIIADKDCLKLNEKQLEDLYQKHSTVIVSRDVIIMSIQSYVLVNLFPYLLHQASEENLVQLGYPLHLVRNEDDEDEDEEVSNRGVAR